MGQELVESLLLDELDELPSEDGASGLVMSHVDHVRVRLTAVLGDTEIALSELLSLKKGQVLPLRQSLDDLVVLQLDGKPVATAHLVAVGDCFGVQIGQVL